MQTFYKILKAIVLFKMPEITSMSWLSCLEDLFQNMLFFFQNLMKNCSEKDQAMLKTGYDMLVKPDKMGDRFKFLAIFPAVMKTFLSKVPPTGFTSSSSSP